MKTDLPRREGGSYLKTKDFQDNEHILTYKGWDQKANEDDAADCGKKKPLSWKEKLIYVLRYSYPEYATDASGNQREGKDGKPWTNKYWDPNFPHGYFIVFYFEEGQLEHGSLPLYEKFMDLRPQPGEKIAISKTGSGTDTRWSVTRVAEGAPKSLTEAYQQRIQKDELDSMDLSEGEVAPF